MISLDDFMKEEDRRKSAECKGVVARYKESTFKRPNGSYVFTEEFYILKRESCPGCEYCGGIYESLSEDYSDNRPINHDGNLKDGDKVYLIIIEDGRDWETGFVDEWHIEARKINRGENRN